jgi:hypothetical protein
MRVLSDLLKQSLLILLGVMGYFVSYAQTIKGKVFDAETGLPLPQVHVTLNNNTAGTRSDSSGIYLFRKLEPGIYTLNASHVGYESVNFKAFSLKAREEKFIEIGLRPVQQILEEVIINAAPFRKGVDVPASLRSLYAAEIQKNPGSDNDISKVIRALPGVTSLAAFRNDLIIRGGAPNENRFFLDDIEIPVINHLVTQGASGGAFSMINSNHLREVEYLSSSFPVNRGNALSSVFGFTLKDGNPDSLQSVLNLGGTEAGFTVDGPLSEKSSMLLSVRRSYRQYILKALNFAFFPVYNDATAKFKFRITPNSTLTFLGIGAMDRFGLNRQVGDNEIQLYLLNNLPESDQSNFTTGFVYKNFIGNSSFTIVGSRSGLFNGAIKYKENIVADENLLLNYTSSEISDRARAEYSWQLEHFKFITGVSFERTEGVYDVFNRIFGAGDPVTVDYRSKLNFSQYGVFTQISQGFSDNRFTVTAGVRADASNYNDRVSILKDQLSPRLSISAALSESVSAHLSAASYFQLPPLMTMSYNNAGETVNREVIKYIRSRHLVTGFKWDNKISGRLSVEGFYKFYPDYMFSLRDNINLAHLPVDFGVFGNFPVRFGSQGRAYGAEFFYQQRLYKGIYGMATYTLGKSEYRDRDDKYLPAAWDARHIVNLTVGKRFNDRWQFGLNWRMQSALPYTPFDVGLSALRSVWDIANQGLRDFDRLQAFRGKPTNLVNIRVDRTYALRSGQLNLYLDIENLLADADSQQALILDRQRDSSGNLTDAGLVINPDAPYAEQRYRVRSIANAQGALIPTFGMIYKW